MTTLRDQFDTIHKKEVQTKNGTITLDYISWSQVADRLDDAAPGWAFTIRQLGEDWCWGQLTIDGRTFDNIGYAENADQAWKKEALKDAVSDALKRCAALAGVGRYLYDRDAPRQNGQSAPQRPPVAAPARSSTVLPEDFDWEELSPIPPTPAAMSGTVAVTDRVELSEGENWCPVHGLAWVLKPAGISKQSGAPYDAFWACASKNKPYCKEKPTVQWIKIHTPVPANA